MIEKKNNRIEDFTCKLSNVFVCIILILFFKTIYIIYFSLTLKELKNL